jgi:hypothetical protein
MENSFARDPSSLGPDATYLRVNPPATVPLVMWVPSHTHGTPFQSSAKAEKAMPLAPDATGVVRIDDAWYVFKE